MNRRYLHLLNVIDIYIGNPGYCMRIAEWIGRYGALKQ